MKKNDKKNEKVKDILKFKIINKLKSVYRLNSVDNRHESTAEHTWSCLALADYFLGKYKINVDKNKVFQILIYHDLPEAYSGDFPLSPREEHLSKKKLQETTELAAALKLKKDLPSQFSERYFGLYKEFEEQKTKEAKFARCIDSFDSVIHELDYKADWRGYTKIFLIEKKRKYFEDFPELKEEFLAILEFMENEGYFK